MATISIFLMFAFSVVLCEKATNRDKRILVNDPNVLHNELQSMRATIQEMSTKMSHQENEISQLKSQLAVHTTKTDNLIDNGVMYIRWGRKQCPDNETQLVYSGYAGGAMYDQTGGAAEYKCLPPDPIYALKDPSIDLSWSGFMYGAEYEALFAADSHDEDVPCALCMSKMKTRQLMIPGRNQCYPEWKKEYSGFLASNARQNPAAGQFICVDEHPEYIPSGIANQNGKLLYFVLSVCGSLPCPPYINNRPMTCVVCSK